MIEEICQLLFELPACHIMSETSDQSDIKTFQKQDDKDTIRHEFDSDDSFTDLLENNIDTEINNSQDDQYTGPVIHGHRFDKRLICIKYPGNVINIDKAVETLGGISSISTIVDSPNRRLELRFRPDDGYSKPTCGDRHSTIGFLLRVKIKKNRLNKAENDTTKIMSTIDSSKTTASCIIHSKEDLNTFYSVKNKYIDDISKTALIKNNYKDNYKDNAVNNLVNVEQDCNVNFMHSNTKNRIENKDDINNAEDLQNICTDIDKNLLKKKSNELHIFDILNNKYKNLSQDMDYDLPHLKVLGRIDIEFKFTNLCDFQYVPITQNKSNPKKLECIYTSIYPTGIPSFSWLKNDVPYFLPPAAFSRMDSIQQYIPKTEIDINSENIIGKNKKCQAGFPNYIFFSTPEVPLTAPKGIETAMKVKFLQNVHLEQVCQLFEERPIWSKNAIMHKTQFTSEQLKILLPSVAYYFMTGPWRIMWVKLGYDPRKDINARKYQTLDYRLKDMYGLGLTVRCKRNYSTYTLPYKSVPISKPKSAIPTAILSQEQNPRKERHLHENVYIYREGMIPPSRQMFYQYCDILVEEIQQMLAKLPDPLPGIRCHEKRGWLPTDFDVQCREIINKQVRSVLRKRMNIPEDYPTSLPRKRKRGIKLKMNKRMNKIRTKIKTNSTKIQSDCASTSELTITKHNE